MKITYASILLLASAFSTLNASPAKISHIAAFVSVSTSPAEDSFTTNGDVQIPGTTLPPGTYAVKVVDRLSDRMVLRIEGIASAPTVVLALRNSKLSSSSKGPIFAKGTDSSTSAMRGFRFADGSVIEFVYPKGEAVSLAKSTRSTFPAIDPESEGRPLAANLTGDDLRLVTLWMLTPKLVGPDDGSVGIVATRYQPEGDLIVSKKRPRTSISSLPHTASSLYIFLIVGIMSLLGAAALRFKRSNALVS